MKHLLARAARARRRVRGSTLKPESAYYGVALGNFDYEENDGFGGELFSDKVSSYRLMVGYQFMEHLAVEGGYGQTGTIRDTVDVAGLRPGAVDARRSQRVQRSSRFACSACCRSTTAYRCSAGWATRDIETGHST